MKKFMIPSLLAAGFLADTSDAATITPLVDFANADTPMIQKLRLNHVYTLVGHSSHSSHASHASHYSHSSSTGGSIPLPRARVQASPRPGAQPLLTLPGNSGKFDTIVRQVEVALTVDGYYGGVIDGVFGPALKKSINNFQTIKGLEVTGTITPELLDALNIVAR